MATPRARSASSWDAVESVSATTAVSVNSTSSHSADSPLSRRAASTISATRPLLKSRADRFTATRRGRCPSACHSAACLQAAPMTPVSYTHLRAHETRHDLVCRLLLEKKKNYIKYTSKNTQ